jgi:hypothetical protein
MDMTSFPKVLMPISLLFLCRVPVGSFAEFAMGWMPFPNVPMVPVPGSLRSYIWFFWFLYPLPSGS